jgi:hypothetical protein
MRVAATNCQVDVLSTHQLMDLIKNITSSSPTISVLVESTTELSGPCGGRPCTDMVQRDRYSGTASRTQVPLHASAPPRTCTPPRTHTLAWTALSLDSTAPLAIAGGAVSPVPNNPATSPVLIMSSRKANGASASRVERAGDEDDASSTGWMQSHLANRQGLASATGMTDPHTGDASAAATDVTRLRGSANATGHQLHLTSLGGAANNPTATGDHKVVASFSCPAASPISSPRLQEQHLEISCQLSPRGRVVWNKRINTRVGATADATGATGSQGGEDLLTDGNVDQVGSD